MFSSNRVSQAQSNLNPLNLSVRPGNFLSEALGAQHTKPKNE
jgi:hypothetical protein